MLKVFCVLCLSKGWSVLQGRTDEQRDVSAPVGTSQDWIVLDSGKSFAWSAQQHGTLQQQFEALDKLIQQQGQQVCRCCLYMQRALHVVTQTLPDSMRKRTRHNAAVLVALPAVESTAAPIVCRTTQKQQRRLLLLQ